MLTYDSQFNPPSPYTQKQRSEALAGLHLESPYRGYGKNQQDILNAAEGINAAGLDSSITKANTDFDLRKMQGEQQLALAGLQQMSQAQQQQNQLATQRLGVVNSFMSPLLQGLFS